MISATELLGRIANMSVEESTAVAEDMLTYKQQATANEYTNVRKALSQRLDQSADQFEREQEEMAIMTKSL